MAATSQGRAGEGEEQLLGRRCWSMQALQCYSSGSRAAAAGRKVPAAVPLLLQLSMNVTHVAGKLMEREPGQAV